MNKDEAREFAAGWLPAWTGNDPEKLLSRNPDWVRTQIEPIPNEVYFDRSELLLEIKSHPGG